MTQDRRAARAAGRPAPEVRSAAYGHVREDSGVEGRARHRLTAGLLAVSGLSFAANAVFSRLLGARVYGAVGSVLALAALLAIPLSAVQAAVTRQVAVDEPGAYRLRGPVLAAACGAGALVVVSAALVPVLDTLLHLSGDWIVVLLGVYLGAILLEGVPRGTLVGERRYTAVAAVVVAGAIARLGVGWVWALLRPDAVGPLAGAAAGELATAVVLLGLLAARRRRGARDRVLHVRDVTLSMAGFTGLLSLMSIDTVAARHWLSAQGSGYYAAASAAGSIAYFAAAAAASAIFPDVAKGVSTDDSRSFWIGLGEVALLGLGTAGILVVASPTVVTVVFGAGYAAARVPMQILAVSYGLLGILGYLVGHHLAHRSRAVLLPWAGAAVLVVAVTVAHRTPTAVAIDALVASCSLVVILGIASVALESRPRRAVGR
ncbi:MAG TPA: hypothetical protein VND23_12090 [Acidimicrobiales bacterium]|nr:hypothetical protein [Acidimicrobiales bacterium]